MDGQPITNEYEMFVALFERASLAAIVVLMLIGLHSYLKLRESSLQSSIEKLLILMDKLIDKKDPS